MDKVTITIAEASNQLVAKMQESNSLYESIFNQIEDKTDILTDEDVEAQKKYDSLVGIEYLLIRIRLKASFEQLKVKSMLSDVNTPASLRGLFLKRAEYLSQLLIRLDSIRDDISVLQKCVYTQQSRSFMK